MSMLIRRLGSLTVALALGLAGCSDNGQGSPTASTEPVDHAPPVTWRFALEEIEGSVQHAYAKEFKRHIEDISDGRIVIDIFPYGALGTSSELTDLTRDGSIHLAFASPGHLSSKVPETGIFTLHFVLPESHKANRALLGDDRLLSLFEAPFAEQDMKLLSIVPEGWMVWTSNQPLRRPDDFKGFRMRTMTSPVSAEAYRAYGAEPTPLPFAEVYSALQLNKVDGQVNPVSAIEEMGFYEVQDIMTIPRHAQFVSMVVSNKAWHDALPDRQRAWLAEALAPMPDFIYDKQVELNAKRLEAIREDSDIAIVELTEEEREAFRQASKAARDAYVELAGERGRKILDTVLELSH